MEIIMKRFLALLTVLVLTLSLCSCGNAEGDSADGAKESKLKASLTSPELTYSKEELEALKEGYHYSYDYGVPALYKYFEGRCQIGCIVNSWQISNPDDTMYKSLAKNYNIYVMENEFKPSSINPAPGVYNFDPCDAFVKFADEAGAATRGHTLLWHAQVPDWWFKADPSNEKSLGACDKDGELASSEQLVERVEEYITEVVTRYKGKVDYWDVVNEVLNADSIRRKGDQSYWADIVGDLDGNGYYDDYVEIAFNAARAADEDAVLMINDFNLEWQDTKVQAMYDMVERMLRKGVRIDGVGFQSHIAVDSSIDAYRRGLEKIASLADIYDECFPEHKGEFRIQITELDMNMYVGAYSDKHFVKWTDEDKERQAKQYADLMNLFLEYADKGLLDAVVFWTPDDGHSWLNDNKNGMPSIYKDDMALKEAYFAFVETSFGANE